jgi:hypothetical protein
MRPPAVAMGRGSCWAFSATEAVESQLIMASGGRRGAAERGEIHGKIDRKIGRSMGNLWEDHFF